MTVYKGETEVFSILFNATDSDKENWYSKNRMIDSPWTDLNNNNNPPPTYFSIFGESDRRFYVSGPHNGCEFDTGWLSIISHHCVYETRFVRTTVMYSKLQINTNWNVYGKEISDVNFPYQNSCIFKLILNCFERTLTI